MGKIRGDVDVVGIATLLQIISTNSLEGTLAIMQGPARKVIEFSPRGIRLVTGARRTNPLGEILVRTGRLTREKLEDLLQEQRSTGKPLGELVAELGILPKHVIDGALREQVAEEIYDLFTWETATFEFITVSEGASPEVEGPLASIVLDANVVAIMLEAARRVDELSRIRSVIPDFRLVAERVELPAALDDPGLDRDAILEILPQVDGERTVGQIIEESFYPTFTVLRTLYGLAMRGTIKIRDKGAGEERPHTILLRRVEPVPEKDVAGTWRVLLLSELPTFRNLLAMFIRGAGYQVVEGPSTVPSAEEQLRQRFDAMVVDVSIETEDGLALCQKIRSLTEVPFIVLAGNSSRQAISNAIESGARFVLLKPVNETLILERLATMIQSPSPVPTDAPSTTPT